MGDKHTHAPLQEHSEPATAEKNAPRVKTPASAYYPPHLSITGIGAPDGPPLTRNDLLFLQRTVGNRAVEGLLQRKGKSGQPEGLSVASAPEEERKKRPEDEGRVQAKGRPGETLTVSRREESRIESMRGGGEPLPQSTRAYFEPRFGQDFSHVRLHRGGRAADSARSVNARAYTTGRDIVFGAGEYRPEESEGRKLLAHELTHVVQQSGGQTHGAQMSAASPASVAFGPTDDAAERDADATAERVVSGGSAAATGLRRSHASVIQRDPNGEQDRIPEPIIVNWGGDHFRIAFRRVDRSLGDASLNVEVTYIGQHAVWPNPSERVKLFDVGIGSRPLRAELREGVPGEVVLDLYGDLQRVLRLQDEIEHHTRASMSGLGRGHGLTLIVGGQFKASASTWTIVDSASTPADTRPFSPGFLPGTVPRFGGAENPTTHKLELKALVDGDGDQYPELEVTIEAASLQAWSTQMRRDEPIRVLLRQAHDPAGLRRLADFQVSAPAGASVAPAGAPGAGQNTLVLNAAKLAADVRLLTDGRAPTVIDLTRPASSEQLLIHPPTANASGISYLVQKGGRSVRYEFPPEPAPLRQTVTADRGHLLGLVAFWDITLGPYNDRFRLMIDPGTTPGHVLAGLAPVGYEVGYVRAAAVPINFAGQQNAIRLLQNGPASVALDFDGDGRPDLVLHDRLQTPPGVSPEATRTHVIRLSGPAVGADQTVTFVRDEFGSIRRPDGVGFTAEDRRMVAAAGATQGLLESEHVGYDQRRLQFEAVFAPYRRRALDSNWITRRTFDAWKQAETDIILLQAQLFTGSVEAALGNKAATHVREFYDALVAETDTATSVRVESSDDATYESNPYTGYRSTDAPFYHTATSGPGAEAATAFGAGLWGVGLGKYTELRAGLDKWILERAERAGTPRRELEQMKASAAMLRQLDSLAGKNPTRIPAVFRPDPKFRGEAGFMEQVPLELYYWREGNEWHLVDLTNPERPYRDSVTAGATDFETADRLMGKLDDEDHFCEGRIYFQVPGIASGQLRVIDRVTWRDFFTWLGIGLAVVGTVLSFGTGAVAVAGAWALAGSAVAGGTAAAINLYQSLQHGTATTTSIILDLTQIVTAIAGVGAIASGRIISQVRTAAAASAPLTGRWATIAAMANRYAIPLAATNLAGDAVTLAVLGVDAITQLDAIENSPGDPEAKRNAKLRLLAQLAFTGGLTALSLRGNVTEILTARRVDIISVGGEPVAVPGGMSVGGRAVTESAAQVGAAGNDAAARALAEQSHLNTIRQRIEGPTGRVLASVEELALAAEARRADSVLHADAAGALTRGGAGAGTLDELTTRVAEANNATRAHGIDIEYVLDISSGGRPGVHEVRVTRRARTPGATGDPRRLYVNVAARTAAEAREVGRLRAAAGATPLHVELTPDGLIIVNGRADMHPNRLAQMPDADVAALASSTHALDAAQGDMNRLKKVNLTAYEQIRKFASSSDSPHTSGHPSRGYRLRFVHSHEAARNLIDDLLGQLGRRREDYAAFRNLTSQDLDRLYDLTTESMPGGTTHVRTQATQYALDQNPTTAGEFVNHYQFYVAEVRLRIKAEVEARGAVGRRAVEAAATQTEASMADAANTRAPSAATAAEVRSQYDRIRTQVGGRLGTSLINPNLDDVATIEAIRALPGVRFSSESAAVYHTYKHYHELPAASRPPGVSEFDAYSAASNAAIHNPAQSAANVAATRNTAQRGGGRSYTFTLNGNGQNMSALVFVSDDGVVFLLTLIPRA